MKVETSETGDRHEPKTWSTIRSMSVSWSGEEVYSCASRVIMSKTGRPNIAKKTKKGKVFYKSWKKSARSRICSMQKGSRKACFNPKCTGKKWGKRAWRENLRPCAWWRWIYDGHWSLVSPFFGLRKSMFGPSCNFSLACLVQIFRHFDLHHGGFTSFGYWRKTFKWSKWTMVPIWFTVLPISEIITSIHCTKVHGEESWEFILGGWPNYVWWTSLKFLLRLQRLTSVSELYKALRLSWAA